MRSDEFTENKARLGLLLPSIALGCAQSAPRVQPRVSELEHLVLGGEKQQDFVLNSGAPFARCGLFPAGAPAEGFPMVPAV